MTSVYALCGGMIELDRSSFFCDVTPGSRITIPVICFLIAHPRGHVLVDTGVHRQAVADPVGRMGERRAKLFGMRGAPRGRNREPARAPRSPAGRRPLRGQLAPPLRPLRRQRVLPRRPRSWSSSAEMDAARRVLAGEAMSYNPSRIDFDLPLDYQLVDGEHDVFGDGQVVLLPTYGHTPGHQSVRVRAAKGADSCSPPMPATRARTWTATCCPRCCGTRRRCRARSGAARMARQAGRGRHLRARRRAVAGSAAGARGARVTAVGAERAPLLR